MKATLPFKSFDEWVSYVFDRPVDEDEAWHWKEPHPFNSCTIDAPKAPSRICLEYCTRLFSRPRFLLNRFSLAQINQALWFIVNASCSSHMFAILDQNLPWLDRKRCIESVFSLNQRLFAVACDEACSHEDSPRNPLNSICYMFWGLIPHGVDWIFPENYTEIMEKLPPGDPGPEVPIDVDSLRQHAREHEAMLATMERILTLPSIACREHALHGLGHFHEYYPRKVQRIIDDFLLRETSLASELETYARAAREGDLI